MSVHRGRGRVHPVLILARGNWRGGGGEGWTPWPGDPTLLPLLGSGPEGHGQCFPSMLIGDWPVYLCFQIFSQWCNVILEFNGSPLCICLADFLEITNSQKGTPALWSAVYHATPSYQGSEWYSVKIGNPYQNSATLP